MDADFAVHSWILSSRPISSFAHRWPGSRSETVHGPSVTGSVGPDPNLRYYLWPRSGGAACDSEALVAFEVSGAVDRSRLRFNRSIASTSAGIVTS